MDIVYASLDRRSAAGTGPMGATGVAGETAEVLAVLWAHATSRDGLQHVTANPLTDRVDLLLYLLSSPPTEGGETSLERAAELLQRCHLASPLMRRRYLPPQIPARPGI